MIKELEGEMTLELLKKYFLNHKQTKNEKKKCKEIYDMFNAFTKKVYGQKEEIFSYCEWFGYLDDFGYYNLVDADPGKCLPYLISYGMDKEKVFYKVINHFLIDCGMKYELKNRMKLRNDFDIRFGEFQFKPIYDLEENCYFNCLYYAEYAILGWDKYYDGHIPNEIINNYENYLNGIWWSKEQGVIWEYDRDNKRFNCKRNTKIRRLEK